MTGVFFFLLVRFVRDEYASTQVEKHATAILLTSIRSVDQERLLWYVLLMHEKCPLIYSVLGRVCGSIDRRQNPPDRFLEETTDYYTDRTSRIYE